MEAQATDPGILKIRELTSIVARLNTPEGIAHIRGAAKVPKGRVDLEALLASHEEWAQTLEAAAPVWRKAVKTIRKALGEGWGLWL